MVKPPGLSACTSSDASGAEFMSTVGMIVVIVDVIDMSTSLEAAREAGALAVIGARPTNFRAPVSTDPQKIGRYAGGIAKKNETKVIIISEPRIGSHSERYKNAQAVIDGIQQTSGEIDKIIPNIGAEIWKLADFKGKVVVAVTASGGTAFDAAWNASNSGLVTTVTIARTAEKGGEENIEAGLNRVASLAAKNNVGIAFIAASGKSIEDVLACEHLYKMFLRKNRI